jgi:hypothetical protein
MTGSRRGTTKRSVGIAKAAPTVTSAGHTEDALVLLAALRQRSSFLALGSRLDPDLFPGDLKLLREVLGKWHRQGKGDASAQGLTLLVRKAAGPKRWTLLQSLCQRWLQIPIPKERVLHEYLEQFVKREGLLRLALEIVEQTDRNELPDPREVQRRLSGLLFSFDSSKDEAIQYTQADTAYLRRLKIQRQSTGVPELDTLMDGGLGDGELGVLLAPYNAGKSSWLVALAGHAVAQGKRVLHVSLELHEWMVLLRYDMHFTGFARTELVKHPELVRRARNTVKKCKGELIISDMADRWMGLADLDSLIEYRGPFDMVALDYAQKLRSRRAYESRRFEIGQIYDELREVASRRQIPIWTAHQATRNAKTDDEFTGADAGEDISTMQTADCVVCIRPSSLWLDKNRNGPSEVVIPVRMDWNTMRVRQTRELSEVTKDATHPKQRPDQGPRRVGPGTPKEVGAYPARVHRPRKEGV